VTPQFQYWAVVMDLGLPVVIYVRSVPSLAACQYKIAVITHKALLTSVPPYIDELLQRQVTTRSLRSTDAPRLSVPWTRTVGSERLELTTE